MKKILTGAVLTFVLLVPVYLFAQTDQLVAQTETGVVQNECVDLKFKLSYLSRDVRTNGEVSVLQSFLISKGYLSDKSTGLFGVLTRIAVQKFQVEAAISSVGASGYGYVGPKTRAKIKEMTCIGATATVTQSASMTEIVGTLSTEAIAPLATITTTSVVISTAPTMSFFSRTNHASKGKPKSVTLFWSSNNTSSCFFEKQTLATSGSMTISLYRNTTYSMSCVGAGGRVTPLPMTIQF